jgi:hypothetical protein
MENFKEKTAEEVSKWLESEGLSSDQSKRTDGLSLEACDILEGLCK